MSVPVFPGSAMTEQPDNWQTPQKVLVILAHPDDPEFFCGATLARWAEAGHIIHYCLLTCGDKGGEAEDTPTGLCNKRHAEQEEAAKVLGVQSVRFLDLEDGTLEPSLELRKMVVRVIRQEKPDILVTSDPTNLFLSDRYINHPDHRYAGQIVLDAVFPAAGNALFFPELLKKEPLEPHMPGEVWVSLARDPNVVLDVSATWEKKIQALKKHASQIGDPEKFEERMRSRKTDGSSEEQPEYEEKFRVIKYRD
jgi:LmbE family N-acetylglucosaminyl deacetylase